MSGTVVAALIAAAAALAVVTIDRLVVGRRERRERTAALCRETYVGLISAGLNYEIAVETGDRKAVARFGEEFITSHARVSLVGSTDASTAARAYTAHLMQYQAGQKDQQLQLAIGKFLRAAQRHLAQLTNDKDLLERSSRPPVEVDRPPTPPTEGPAVHPRRRRH